MSNHDKSRNQYISHKLYLERRAGNRFYNLGYLLGFRLTEYIIQPTQSATGEAETQ